MKRSNVGVLLFCGGCPRYAASTFAFLRRSMEADATRLSIINRKSGKRSLQRTAARRCPRMPAEDWSWIRKIAIGHKKKKKKKNCNMSSLQRASSRNATFHLSAISSSLGLFALTAPVNAKRSTLTDWGSFAGPAPKLMTCLCSMFKYQMFPRCDCFLLLSPSAGFLLSCTRRRCWLSDCKGCVYGTSDFLLLGSAQ